MATAIKYFDTAKIAHCRVTTGVTATDGSTGPTDFTWYNVAPTGDWMPVQCIISASSATGVGNPADCIVTFFVDDATTPRKILTLDLGDQAVGSTTAGEGQWVVNFGPSFVLPTSMNLGVTVSVTPTAGNLDFVLFAQAA
jgi:hypothetical protein